jgi:uncharacterized protein
MKRVIITGGTGFIGVALANELLKNGYEVIALTRNPDKAKLPQGVRSVKWDGHTAEGWGEFVNGADAIVNLAGESIGVPPLPWTPERKKKIRDSRVNAGQAIVAAVQAAEEKPRVLIQSSAVGYYGPHRDDVVTEDTPAGTDFLAKVCTEWETSTADVWSLGVRRVVIRTGLPLSFSGGVLPWFALPFKFFVGGPIGNGKQYVPWIHISDYVSAIRFLIENTAARGAFNLSAPNPVTNAEMATALGHALKRPSWFPAPAVIIQVALGELADSLLLSGQRQMPTRLQQLGFKFNFTQIENALRDLKK